MVLSYYNKACVMLARYSKLEQAILRRELMVFLSSTCLRLLGYLDNNISKEITETHFTKSMKVRAVLLDSSASPSTNELLWFCLRLVVYEYAEYKGL